MSTQKVMIIVLVAVVIIFVITVGIGGCHGSRTPSADHPGAVGALKGLQGKRFLVIGDKARAAPPSCGSPGAATLTVNGTCVITFEKRAFFRTSTRVVFRPSASIHVTINPENGPDQEKQLAPFQCFASAVDHAGGKMTLIGNATIFLQRQPCPT